MVEAMMEVSGKPLEEVSERLSLKMNQKLFLVAKSNCEDSQFDVS